MKVALPKGGHFRLTANHGLANQEAGAVPLTSPGMIPTLLLLPLGNHLGVRWGGQDLGMPDYDFQFHFPVSI